MHVDEVGGHHGGDGAVDPGGRYGPGGQIEHGPSADQRRTPLQGEDDEVRLHEYPGEVGPGADGHVELRAVAHGQCDGTGIGAIDELDAYGREHFGALRHRTGIRRWLLFGIARGIPQRVKHEARELAGADDGDARFTSLQEALQAAEFAGDAITERRAGVRPDGQADLTRRVDRLPEEGVKLPMRGAGHARIGPGAAYLRHRFRLAVASGAHARRHRQQVPHGQIGIGPLEVPGNAHAGRLVVLQHLRHEPVGERRLAPPVQLRALTGTEEYGIQLPRRQLRQQAVAPIGGDANGPHRVERIRLVGAADDVEWDTEHARNITWPR